MLDAIQRQRLERRWAFLIVCAIVVLAIALQLAHGGWRGADPGGDESASRESDDSVPDPVPRDSSRFSTHADASRGSGGEAAQ